MPLYTNTSKTRKMRPILYEKLCMKIYLNDEKIQVGCWAHHDCEGVQTSVLCGFEEPIFLNCFEQVLQQDDFLFCSQISFQTFTIKYGRARKYFVSISLRRKHCSKVEINNKK